MKLSVKELQTGTSLQLLVNQEMSSTVVESVNVTLLTSIEVVLLARNIGISMMRLSIEQPAKNIAPSNIIIVLLTIFFHV